MQRTLSTLVATIALLGSAGVCAAQAYKVTNLVSDGSVPAITTDANFLNPWGVSVSPTWWISTANTGFNFVIPATTDAIAFKVVVPPGTAPHGVPAGSVTTAGASGMILPNGSKASFLFSTLDGTISGWNGKLGTNNSVAQIVINHSASGASYPGLAILNVGSTASYILAPNFAGGTLEVYDSTFQPTKLANSFTDPNLPSGYAPFSVHILNGQVWVAYALRTSAAPFRTVDAPGNGIVSVFDNTGKFVARAVTGGNLNSPWGVAFAPANFGLFSGDLLIGNFGDGLINVYDPKTYAYLGQLVDATGKSLMYASLWELLPGGTPVLNATTVSGGDVNTVYFTAGLAGEAHGLLGAISFGTATGSPAATFGFTASQTAATVGAGAALQETLSVAPVNGFNGTVSFACTGLPAGALCAFSPSTVTASSGAPSLVTLTILTTHRMTAAVTPLGGRSAVLALALLLPFCPLLLGRRRQRWQRVLGSAAVLAVVSALGAGMGCGSSSAMGTPAGQSNVTITATSGATTQTVPLALTVQ